jgi:hypothetical protein
VTSGFVFGEHLRVLPEQGPQHHASLGIFHWYVESRGARTLRHRAPSHEWRSKSSAIKEELSCLFYGDVADASSPEEERAGAYRPKLFCLPLGVKDSLCYETDRRFDIGARRDQLRVGLSLGIECSLDERREHFLYFWAADHLEKQGGKCTGGDRPYRVFGC